jgi:TPR repeat protein
MPEVERYQQYEVLRKEDGTLWELGRGAMGITYKAFDTNLRCEVCLKVINSTYLQNDTARQRFLREARSAAALRHPNVASVFNLSTDRDNYFYVMEFIDGETVEACVKRHGHLGPAEALNIAVQVARALAAAAKQHLVHRDLKPSNLMLVDQEGESVVKVIDFGLAKSAKDAAEDTGALTMGGFVGTPHFASPEQIEEGDLDVRSDIYSLGATLYFMLTGEAPFSGSVGQVMSQHLYKAITVEPLTGVPQSVISLIQKMLEKDRERRHQTPRDLQNAIADCLEEIRIDSVRGTPETAKGPPEPLAPSALLGRDYRLIEEVDQSPQGRHFLADDLRRTRVVRLLILNPDLVSDTEWFTPLRETVEQVRKAPHSMLRTIYSLETAGGHSVLVEEHVVGVSLLDLLRSRGVLSAPEVAWLLRMLAPLGDHASANRLEHVDLSLQGIHFINRESTVSETDLLQRPLTAWERLEPKVSAIDFSFTTSYGGTLGLETRMLSAADSGPRGSPVRSLSLLAYELLGGARARVEATGQYKPIAALTQEGNAVLRRGLIDECPSATELAGQLAAAVALTGPAPPVVEARATHATKVIRPIEKGKESFVSKSGTPLRERLLETSQPEIPALAPPTRASVMGPRRLLLAGAFILSMGIGGYLIYLQLNHSQEIAALSIQIDPPGASVFLDGKPPQAPPNTFTHVPVGTHQLIAALDGYDPVKQAVEVRAGMTPEIRLQLHQKLAIATPEIHPTPTPAREIPALSVQTDPPGAYILLDGKPPQTAPGTFTQVPFGAHQLTATLDDYEPIKQDIEVSSGTAPEINFKFSPKPIEDLLAEAKKYDQGSPNQISAYVRIVRVATASGAANAKEYTDGLARIIEQLRTRVPPVTQDEFGLSYKKSVRDAAALDILPAIVWLAENEKGSEQLNLFLRAAKLGDSYAMMRAGRLYLRKGTQNDKEEGVRWLNQAYNAPARNLEAGAYLGECYLSGIGTDHNEQKGEEIIIPLAKQNVVPAMTLAGEILLYKADINRSEIGGSTSPQIRKQLEAEANDLDRQARAWWERSTDKGDWYAAAHLGQFYEEGRGGVEKSDQEAEKLYKKGIDHSNSLCMYNDGFLLAKKADRRSEAESLMSQAASAGQPKARAWCRENNVAFTEVKADD